MPGSLLSLLLLVACEGGDNTPAGADLSLDPGFGSASVEGTTSGGPVEDAVCPGLYPEAPQHRMELSGAITGMVVELDTDEAVMMIIYEQSEFCSEVVEGTSAIERGSWSPGTYEIYVGLPAEGADVAYVLTAMEP